MIKKFLRQLIMISQLLKNVLLFISRKRSKMKEKDIAEKILLSFNDVFADVVNGTIFDGRDVVKSEDLEETATVSQFKDDENIHHEQLRDVAKFWKKNGVIFSFIGIENQSVPDEDLILRVCAYDGVTYKNQQGRSEIYPVFTIVIYWGKAKWTVPTSLKERITCPPELEGLISDHKFKLVEMTRLTYEEIEKYKSDFQFIAGSLSNIKGYRPGRDLIKHPSEVLDVLCAIEGDKRFKEIKHKIETDKKEGRRLDMCEYLDTIKKEGIECGIRLGEERGKEQGILSSIRKLMSNLKLSLEEALDTLEISEEEKPKYREMMKNIIK